MCMFRVSACVSSCSTGCPSSTTCNASHVCPTSHLPHFPPGVTQWHPVCHLPLSASTTSIHTPLQLLDPMSPHIAPCPTPAPTLPPQGFAALRALPYQGYLQRCSSSALTHNMLVEATAAALPARPMHQGNPMYPFSYRVRVTNLSAMWVQLLGREWVFKDGAGGLVSAVPLQRDNAVVGECSAGVGVGHADEPGHW